MLARRHAAIAHELLEGVGSGRTWTSLRIPTMAPVYSDLMAPTSTI